MIISELCQNHLGAPEILKDMVEAAASAGSNFCKIQTFFADDLAPEWEHDRARLKKLELNWEVHRQFVEWCTQAGTIPMTSVYTHRYAEKLWDCGFRWIKIGSAQATDKELIEYYVKTGFKVIVSTGGHTLEEIPKVHPLAGVLHCVSKYPCRAYESNLCRMWDLKKYFPSTPYGFSSHINPLDSNCMDVLCAALTMGATFIEVHFTILSRDQTKDGPVSLTLDQLIDLCKYDRLSQKERLLRSPEYGVLVYPPKDEERELIQKYKGRWKTG